MPEARGVTQGLQYRPEAFWESQEKLLTPL